MISDLSSHNFIKSDLNMPEHSSNFRSKSHQQNMNSVFEVKKDEDKNMALRLAKNPRYEDSPSQFLDTPKTDTVKLPKLARSHSQKSQNNGKFASNSNAKVWNYLNTASKVLGAGHASLGKLRQIEQINSKIVARQNGNKEKQLDKSAQEIQKEFIAKMKQWSEQKEKISRKKQDIIERKAKRKQLEEQEKQFKQEQLIEQLRREKKKQIEMKIQEIERKREEREILLKNSILREEKLPKYRQLEQKFKQKEEQEGLLEIQRVRKQKQDQSVDIEKIKAHEKAYVHLIKERFNAKMQSKNKSSSDRQTKSEFNLYLRRDEEEKRAEMEKIVRRKQFQEKLNKIPIVIDEQKKLKTMIAIDKLNNPQKYHFLQQKSLTDLQIYKEFKDFDITSDAKDPKQLGKDYLKQVKQLPKKRVLKYISLLEPALSSKTNSDNTTRQMNLEGKVFPSPIQPRQQSPKKRSPSELYEQSLKKAQQKDQDYLTAMKQRICKLAI